jgi:hypothetical protein
MIYDIDAYKERMSGQPPASSGVYAAWSQDGLAWSKPTRLIADQSVPQTGKSVSWEASVVWDDESQTHGYLLYGYSPSWGSVPHFLVGRRLSIELVQ